jgi:hypothetical protein
MKALQIRERGCARGGFELLSRQVHWVHLRSLRALSGADFTRLRHLREASTGILMHGRRYQFWYQTRLSRLRAPHPLTRCIEPQTLKRPARSSTSRRARNPLPRKRVASVKNIRVGKARSPTLTRSPSSCPNQTTCERASSSIGPPSQPSSIRSGSHPLLMPR